MTLLSRCCSFNEKSLTSALGIILAVSSIYSTSDAQGTSCASGTVGHNAAKWCPPAPTYEIPYYFGPGLNSTFIASAGELATRNAIWAAAEGWNAVADVDLAFAFHLHFGGYVNTSSTPDYGILFTYGLGSWPTVTCTNIPANSVLLDICGYGNAWSETVPLAATTTNVNMPGNTDSIIRTACVDLNDNAEWSDVSSEGYNRLQTVLHEMGHALGLGHSSCENDLMYASQGCNQNRSIDASAIATMQCLYGTDDNCHIIGMTGTDWYVAGGSVVIRIGSCNCSSACDFVAKARSASGTGVAIPSPIFELAISDAGGPYNVFAVITQDQLVNNEYRHIFPRSYDFANLRVRVFKDGTQAQEVSAYHPLNIPQGLTCPLGNRSPELSSSVPCDSTIEILVGTSLSFSISVRDSDSSDIDTLKVIGLPLGASAGPAFPATGNPVSSNITWTPTEADTGNYAVFFSATDGCGAAFCRITIKVISANLAVTPDEPFLINGPSGGPFVPNCKSYQLQNTGNVPINWSAACDAAWITISDSQGTLEPGGATPVQICVNAGANGLPPDQYPASCTFTNETLGTSQTRPIKLAIFSSCPDDDYDGYTPCDGDCDDLNPNVHPGAPEICNGIDDDCNGIIDDTPTPCTHPCPDADGDGWTTCAGDCDDTDPNVHPGMTETCNWIDDDCNGAVDDTPAPCSLTCLPPPAGMVAWWPGDGNTNDIIGARNGSLGSASFVPGKVANAFSFNGSSCVAVEDDPIWTLGTHDFTIDLWVNVNGLSGRDPFIAHDNASDQHDKWIFWYDRQGHDKYVGIPALRFHINSPHPGATPFPHDAVVAPWNPELGRWYQVAVTRRGIGYTLYIDGAAVASDTSSFSIPDPTASLTIGCAESYNLNGLVDEVEIFNRALSSSEIRAIFNAGSLGKCKGTVVANQPPDCSQAVAMLGDPGSVAVSTWPPNGKLMPFRIEGVTDPELDPVTIHITGITQDEPVNAQGDHNTCPDAAINAQDSGNGFVRIERAGTGNGRVYAISFRAEDIHGGSCDGTTTLCVPHDKGSHDSCIDDGQLYDSLENCSRQALDLQVSGAEGGTRTITYFLPSDSNVAVKVYDVAGRHVATLDSSRKSAGLWQTNWQANVVPSGIYFIQLVTDLGNASMRVLVVK